MQLQQNRNFVILFSGQILSVIGDNLFNIALLWYVLVLTQSRLDVAITSFSITLPPIMGIFMGVLVDRWRKKTTMMTSDVARAIILFSLFALALDGHPAFWMVVGLVVLLESVGTVFTPSFSSLLPHIVESKDYTTASGLLQSSNALAGLGGMLGGGALMTFLGAPVLFLSDGISFVISVVSLLFVRSKEPPRSQVSESFLKEWRAGVRALFKSPFLTQMAVTSAINNLSLAGFDMSFMVWVKSSLHGTAMTLSFLMGAFFVGLMTGGLTVGYVTKRLKYRIIIPLSTLALGLGVSTAAISHNMAVDLAILLAAGFSLGTLDGAAGGLSLRVIPTELRGRITSVMFTFSRVATPIGVAVIGGLMTKIPLTVAVMITGVGPIACGLSYLLPFAARKLDALDGDEQRGYDSDSVSASRPASVD